jgi:hypothetical protein
MRNSALVTMGTLGKPIIVTENGVADSLDNRYASAYWRVYQYSRDVLAGQSLIAHRSRDQHSALSSMRMGDKTLRASARVALMPAATHNTYIAGVHWSRRPAKSGRS